jgi:hypothetical protein
MQRCTREQQGNANWPDGNLPQGLTSSRENSSFAPLGLDHSHLYPRLTPWAVFFRRFAARTRWPCSTLNLQGEISRTH